MILKGRERRETIVEFHPRRWRCLRGSAAKPRCEQRPNHQGEPIELPALRVHHMSFCFLQMLPVFSSGFASISVVLGLDDA